MLDEEIFTVQDVPLKGKGLVAATRIPKEVFILTESPLTEVPRDGPSHEALHQIIIEVGITETNGLCPGPDAKNGAVFRTTSRLNHSCKPMHRLKIIITYLGEPLLAYEQRQKKLKDAFNFDCYCRLCYLSSAENRGQDIGASMRPVAYNTRIRGREIDDSKPGVGRTVVMLYAAQHIPMDRAMGVIHGDPGQLRILPTYFKDLLHLNDKVQEYSVVHNQTRKCHGCEKELAFLKKCSRCGFFWYCNQDCQARRWNMYEHRHDCGLLRNGNVKGLFLVKWNELKTGVSFQLSV
ncbi:unnamed protein product [Fusarium venenatum]|uniref:MYND-type domain-containing protein n=1 Tax=Fusarium venenatum TaxID=56646 RepID=A0A2L2TLX6_9HYPO|nr:uncharacterized protein FVRRES_09310 [Fusarium venenatum]CEI69233.1 unnamed protein product [Fusarium venenatum]